MSKRFVVLLNSEAESQLRAFEGFLKVKYYYWHWLQNSWLIIDPTGELTVKIVRDKVDQYYAGVHSLVIEIQGNDTWSGFGPESDQQDMFGWLHDNWKHQ